MLGMNQEIFIESKIMINDKLKNEKILNLTLHEIMEIVDNHPNIKVDLVDNLYYALLDNCVDNPNKEMQRG